MKRDFILDTSKKDVLYLPHKASDKIPLNGGFIDYQTWCKIEVLRINHKNPSREAEIQILRGNDHGKQVKKIKVLAYPYKSVDENKKPKK